MDYLRIKEMKVKMFVRVAMVATVVAGAVAVTHAQTAAEDDSVVDARVKVRYVGGGERK